MQVRNHPMSNRCFCTDPTVCIHFFERKRQWRGGTGGRTVRRSRLPSWWRACDSRPACLPGVSVLSVVAQCQWWVVAQWEGTVGGTVSVVGGVTVGRHSGKEGRRPLPSTVMMQGRPARCVSALSGGTVGRTVSRSRGGYISIYINIFRYIYMMW